MNNGNLNMAIELPKSVVRNLVRLRHRIEFCYNSLRY